MKKVLIITLSQGANYGGMLQAYGLQETIKKLGYDVQTTFSKGPYSRRAIRAIPGIKTVARILKRNSKKNDEVTTRYTRKFVSNYLSIVGFDKAFLSAKRGQYEAYVSGSDQVWRSKYTYVPHNLLNFAPNNAIKISYAGSFGKNDLTEYGDKLIAKTKKYAHRMTALSVRENSGIDVASTYWGVKAVQHVDPTLLISKDMYVTVIDKATDATHKSEGGLFSYVLDPAKDKQAIANNVATKLALKTVTIIDGDENNGKPMPPVEQWLRSFRDAKYVVTDSFHGMVFSIIFNKPFIAIGNKERGLARFTSLLEIFGLQDRLVLNESDITNELIDKKIDWAKVNAIKAAEQARSIEYLKKYLEKVS